MTTQEEKIGKYSRITGTDRQALTSRVKALYEDREMSIREIADQTGRSYGAIHRLLADAGVTFRPRGNPAR